ncbi:MAG: 5-hydroxyisourate hydrolase-like protein (transthyretin family) [Psychroserpens sp.]|jgi:5-hydroxyisourate hydrolase-like protein (transthyretin family)
MRVGKTGHLSYCTNIHAGESWTEMFENLKVYLLNIKQKVSEKEPFGIGLRLSHQAAVELSNKTVLQSFKKWLILNNLYVFTINGFPYGNFHGETIKDQVHTPDWTTDLRKEYTILLFDILGALVPEHLVGGISTSPISYKYWYTTEVRLEDAKIKACDYLIDVVQHLMDIKNLTGKSMHLDIEPEPDGCIENSKEFLHFYNDYLLKLGVPLLMKKNNYTTNEADNAIREHIQLCFDICHFSIAYEKPSEVIKKMRDNRIKIGKVQISAALKCNLENNNTIQELQNYLRPFHEPNYLHQAVIKTKENNYLKFRDLDVAIAAMNVANFKELRTHYHVPVFLAEYQELQSTQDDIIETLQLWKTDNFTDHLEIETYTWDVLPDKMKTDIIGAVTREINWVRNSIGQTI